MGLFLSIFCRFCPKGLFPKHPAKYNCSGPPAFKCQKYRIDWPLNPKLFHHYHHKKTIQSIYSIHWIILSDTPNLRVPWSISSDVSRVFWADWYTYRSHEDSTMVGAKRRNFQNVCLQILYCTPWLSVLRFLCKTFSRSLKVTIRKALFCGWFLKKSYIQIKKIV